MIITDYCSKIKLYADKSYDLEEIKVKTLDGYIYLLFDTQLVINDAKYAFGNDKMQYCRKFFNRVAIPYSFRDYGEYNLTMVVKTNQGNVKLELIVNVLEEEPDNDPFNIDVFKLYNSELICNSIGTTNIDIADGKEIVFYKGDYVRLDLDIANEEKVIDFTDKRVKLYYVNSNLIKGKQINDIFITKTTGRISIMLNRDICENPNEYTIQLAIEGNGSIYTQFLKIRVLDNICIKDDINTDNVMVSTIDGFSIITKDNYKLIIKQEEEI